MLGIDLQKPQKPSSRYGQFQTCQSPPPRNSVQLVGKGLASGGVRTGFLLSCLCLRALSARPCGNRRPMRPGQGPCLRQHCHTERLDGTSTCCVYLGMWPATPATPTQPSAVSATGPFHPVLKPTMTCHNGKQRPLTRLNQRNLSYNTSPCYLRMTDHRKSHILEFA